MAKNCYFVTRWLLVIVAFLLTLFGMMSVVINPSTNTTHNSVIYYMPDFRNLSRFNLVGGSTSPKAATSSPYTLDLVDDTNTTYYLGCFIISKLQYQAFTNPKVHINIPLITNSSEHCVTHCTERNYMYSYLIRSIQQCYCDNWFQTAGLDTLPCERDETSAEVYTTGQAASAKYSLLNHMYRNDSCQCTDRMCWKLECPSNDRHSICYVGPSKAKLKVYTEGDKCTYIVHPFPKYDRKWHLTTYCLNSLEGFLPAKCGGWYRSSRITPRYAEQRFYTITSNTKHHNKIVLPVRTQMTQHKVLLLTFMRSGSTFLSEFFKGHPDSYYLYEPLHGLTSDTVYSAHEGPDRHMMSNRSTELLDRLFSCKFDLTPSSATLFPTRKMDSFFKACVPYYEDLRISCLQAHYSSCQTSQLVAIKTIRAQLAWAKTLIDTTHQDLKVVLLFRDPRGLMSSRMKMSNLSNHEVFKEKTKGYCDSVMAEIALAKQMLQSGLYENQLLVIRYEDVVTDNLQAANHIYRSLSLGEVPPELETHIIGLTGPDTDLKSSRYHRKAHKVFGTHREDSFKTAYTWKEKMSYSRAKVVDNICGEAYEAMGYLPINSEAELRNRSIYHITEPFSII